MVHVPYRLSEVRAVNHDEIAWWESFGRRNLSVSGRDEVVEGGISRSQFGDGDGVNGRNDTTFGHVGEYNWEGVAKE